MLSSQIKVQSLEDVQAGQGVSFSLKKVWLKKNLEMVATLNESERNPYENNAWIELDLDDCEAQTWMIVRRS